jgi:soluble lytic murein transglycosylase-like protein
MFKNKIGAAAIAGALLIAACPTAGFSQTVKSTQTFGFAVADPLKTAESGRSDQTAKLAKKKLADAKRISDQANQQLQAYNQMMKAFDGKDMLAVEMQREVLQKRADKATSDLARLEARFSPSTASNSTAYQSLIAKYASAYGVPLKLAHAVVRVESNYRANARGSAGEIGLMQIKPSTARMMGYTGSSKGLYNPETNIKYGMKYLGEAHRLANGSTCGTILRYNAGHGATRMNPVSASYCKKVQRFI